MRAAWGNYLFPVNGCEVTSRTRLITSDTGRPIRYVTRVSVAGWLEADGQAALAVAEASLRAALLTNYLDFRFLTDAGAVTPLSLLNSQSISGVRVVDGPNFTGTDGAEYATVRRFEFEVEAEFLIANAANAVLAYQETVSITGDGGPRYVLRVPINARVLVRQKVSERTPVRAVQTGRAVGHVKYPPVPPPLWPRPIYQGDQGNVVRDSPRRLGLGLVEFGVSWSYPFESDGPLVGVPGLPPL
ncbi:hypothetical protein GobsT_37780 [Gemmata obscuriglobus]|uniref:Uncharacterized protein n=1 Tax=Gemmata obscuriglobus TaxID=114 RepID=A0A2Z3GUN2_9BACT|nr:hypothetical protein [Gemmata obscuriglobus]AWM38129.1 hypothetical protein C1280_14755 [Gemmata obscuriglobus]QEG28989.1 hypothetical protein GobsT_37780 [Gemmata obscuriglobus]VTS07553.1 Uncharacterized protein OS=Blastopirellula marina DSM 3645 GN=DSM3645_28797 PE=4 SV=1 [Gemmata obscuriglobus UQM 2246]